MIKSILVWMLLLQKKHDEIRGVKGAFIKSLKRIRKIKEYFVVSIVFTAHSKNLKELPGVAKIAKDNGVSLTIKRYIPVGRGSGSGLTLSPSQYKILVNTVRRLKKDQSISFSDPFPASFGKRTNTFGGCLAGIYTLSMDYNGDVFICTKLKKPLLGNLRKTPLAEIWRNSKMLQDLRNRKLKGKCKECDRILSCGGCRAAAYAETGDFLAADHLCFYQQKV